MDKTYYKSINETVYHTISQNGIDVHIIKKEGFTNKAAYFATKFGSFNTNDTICNNNQETKVIGGVAHFLEHRLFDYKEGNIIDLYYKLGADVNAYTSYDRTVYYFSTTDNFDKCLDLLLDFPTSFTMSEQAVENEKDIIVSELLMYKDDPNDKLYKGIMNALYKEHPIKMDVGGEPEEVRQTTRELLELVHTTFYNPKNMHLVIVGDVDIDATLNLINNKKFKESSSIYKKNVINEPIDIVKNEVIINADVNNTKMMIGYKLPPLDGFTKLEKERMFLSFDLLLSILFSSSSDFYNKMIEEKYISSFSYDILEYENLFCLLIEADILKDYQDVINRINDRLNNVNDILLEEKLNSIKKKEIASIIKGSDLTNSLAKNYMTYLLDDMNYFEMIDLVKSITINDLLNIVNYYKDAKYSYAILKPQENNN